MDIHTDFGEKLGDQGQFSVLILRLFSFTDFVHGYCASPLVLRADWESCRERLKNKECRMEESRKELTVCVEWYFDV